MDWCCLVLGAPAASAPGCRLHEVPAAWFVAFCSVAYWFIVFTCLHVRSRSEHPDFSLSKRFISFLCFLFDSKLKGPVLHVEGRACSCGLIMGLNVTGCITIHRPSCSKPGWRVTHDCTSQVSRGPSYLQIFKFLPIHNFSIRSFPLLQATVEGTLARFIFLMSHQTADGLIPLLLAQMWHIKPDTEGWPVKRCRPATYPAVCWRVSNKLHKCVSFRAGSHCEIIPVQNKTSFSLLRL